jgi:hypothetical protein
LIVQLFLGDFDTYGFEDRGVGEDHRSGAAVTPLVETIDVLRLPIACTPVALSPSSFTAVSSSACLCPDEDIGAFTMNRLAVANLISVLPPVMTAVCSEKSHCRARYPDRLVN